ncbi:hypothetical protein N5V81_22020 [Escherichia coli]|nr:hypothetical protein [Escherichia coli]
MESLFIRLYYELKAHLQKRRNQGRFLLQQLLSVLTGSANRSDIISTRTELTPWLWKGFPLDHAGMPHVNWRVVLRSRSMLWDALADCENDGLFKVHTVTPTTAKKFARSHLPEELAFEEKKKLDKKTGKEHTVKKPVTMDKKLMVKACEVSEPGFLDGINLRYKVRPICRCLRIGRAHLEGLSQSVK